MEEIIEDFVKENAKEFYHDALQPSVQSFGKTLTLIPRAINVALSPFEALIMYGEYSFERVKKLIEEKMKNLSPEQIEKPEPYIAVPALQYISYCMDNHELRDMYANLLASSMNKVVKNDVHPGYVETIKQLCPDEAKILKYIAEKNNIPTISLYYGDQFTGMKRIIKDFSDVGYLTHCEKPLDVSKYFVNFVRLGLLEIPDSSPSMHSSLSNEKLYEPLKKHPYIQSCLEKLSKIGDKNNSPEVIEGYASMTDYGIGFCAVCLDIHMSSNNINGTAIVDNSEYLTGKDIATDEEVNNMLDDVWGK